MITFIVALRNYHVNIYHKNKLNSPSDLKRDKKKYNSGFVKENIKTIEATDIPVLDWRPGLLEKQTEMCWVLHHPKQARCSPEGR